MLYVLILLLAGVLVVLLRIQKRRERDWRQYRLHISEGLPEHPSVAHPAAAEYSELPFHLSAEQWQPENPPCESGNADEQASAGQLPAQADEAGQGRAIQTPSADAAETISTDEVLRNLANSRMAEQIQPPVIIVEADETDLRIRLPDEQAAEAEIIGLAEATRLQHRPLSEHLRHDGDAVTPSSFAETAVPPADERATAETIDWADIHHNLLRQRIARHHQHAQSQSDAAARSQAATELHEIPDSEIWANLNHSHIPAAKRMRAAQSRPSRPHTDANSQPMPQRFTPFANRPSAAEAAAANSALHETVSIAEPPVFPAADIPVPEIEFQTVRFPAAAETAPAETAAWLSDAAADVAVENDETDTPLASSAVIEPEAEAHLAAADEGESWLDTFNAAFEAEPQPEHHVLPPLNLLLPPVHNPNAVQSPEDLLENSIIIEEKLAEYRVKVKVLDAYAGPVITRYEIEPDTGVRGSSVMNLEKDLARSLGVAAIRVVETIPGKTCMGLELPNPKRQMIRLREVFNSPAFSGSTSKLTLALGQDITGAPVVTDLAKAPHLLVAGTTGSGKSVGVNSMILSMLYKATPDEVRLIMIDPKMLELSIYEGIPHLLAPVVTDMKLAANALTWCVNEMEKRYRLMSHVGVRNLAGYNQKISEAAAQGRKIANPFSFTPDDAEPLEKLPFIVVVVDEFADLMMVAGKQIEQLIARLAQKARAAGIHLILATQRPSVDVITGLIKANIPTRIAFQVSTKIDSRTILDQMGAENLLGQGDMLFLPPGTGYPQRVHGAFVADNEVHAVVEYLKQFGEPDYVDDILNPIQEEFGFDGGGNGNERDPLFDKAVEVIIRTKKATVSSLQRHLRIGYNKAATLIDQLEAEGIVSAADHTGKRTILARKHEQS